MGKKIDRFVLNVLLSGCLYLYFLQATQKPLLSIGIALICCIVISRVVTRLIGRISSCPILKKRRYCRQASGIIMELACAQAAHAQERLQMLIEKTFHEQYPLELIQAHPSEKLSAGSVFQAWKRHQNQERLVICATCGCDSEVRMLASALTAPRIAIVDAERLKQLMAEFPEDFQLSQGPKRRAGRLGSRLMQRFLQRRNAPKCMLCGFSSILMYILSGNLLYLPAAMLLFLTAILSFRRPPCSSRLF